MPYKKFLFNYLPKLCRGRHKGILSFLISYFLTTSYLSNPHLYSPFIKGGFRGILVCSCFIFKKKFIEKLMRVKENIKMEMDKRLCIDSWGHFFGLMIITLGTSSFDLTPSITSNSSKLFVLLFYPTFCNFYNII